MTPDIFQSEAALRTAFEAGLAGLLGHDGLGTFILATANAGFEPSLWEHLSAPLSQKFEELTARYRRILACGGSVPDSEEDLTVFLKMALLGFEGLQPTQFHQVGPWEVQYNPLRAFRPRRMSRQPVSGIRRPFDAGGFHFNKPFMTKEILWEGERAGLALALYYNKYPFAPLHGLLVPERHRQYPQFLEQRIHAEVWNLVAGLGDAIAGIGLGYNSFGANASVNHLHFQSFVRRQPLPVADARFRHNGGEVPYPADCERFDSARQLWERIAALHERETAYNLLYLPGHAYLLPRRTQGSFEEPAWSAGTAWYELSGGVITFDQDHLEHLTAADIEHSLAATRLPGSGV